ncbi:thiol reductant ABC exporter subunit CydC [Cocleimonas flava]|uniref:ATP-binding cassette subfamily C protein CydC n=1 Tax=Cocleimonas flava TaxID=634765 RepID=A0A4R1EXS9_9GAMM|nr:thiol reductant ABC exporter subunit CydC [Cocleimonas flava]TCJ84679.1 ATP-binding cassette subfamily C protein CydC [Cocleimonas flava]
MMSDFQVMRRLFTLIKPWWGWMLLGVVLSLLTILANIGLMALSGWFIASMAIAGITGAAINYFTPAALIRAFAIIRTSSRYAERLVTHEATFRLIASLRSWFYDHLEPLAPAVIQNYRSGDLLSRIRADIDTLDNFYLRIIAPVTVAFISSIIIVIFLWQYSQTLALIELFFLVAAGVLLPLLINRWGYSASSRQSKITSELRSAVMDSTQGMSELLINDAAKRHSDSVEKLSEGLLKDQKSLATLNGGSQAMSGLLANLCVLLMLIIAIPMVNSEAIGPASLPMLALFTMASFEAIMPLSLAFQTLPTTLAAARRLFDIVDSKPAVIEPEIPHPLPDSADLVFHSMSLRYPSQETDTLQNINVNIPTGTHIAIVGPSGSGKSSLINALMKFWPVSSGEISYGGVPIEHLDGEELRSQFAVASQHSTLFNSTIKRNLLLANRKATDSELESVCKVAQIHDFIMELPEGYDTWIGEAGHKLSGGQMRRISIARTLLKSAPILILDEPGEGLDSITEKNMLHSIIEHNKQRTLILITHHLSGLDAMDQIVRIEKGNIVSNQDKK